MSVLVFGSLHWDVIVRADRLPAMDETLMGSEVRDRFGGKGGNQALAARRAGAEVAFAGAVGTDAAADRLLAQLAEAGVDHGRVDRTEGASGLSVAIETATGGYGAVVVSAANREVTAPRPPWPAGLRVAAIQNEVPMAANVDFAWRLPKDVFLVWNAAPAAAEAADLLARVDLLVVNRVEAAQMGGRTRLAKVGPVIETRGAEGCVLADATGEVAFPAPDVPVVSTHGAGDAFCGALAAALDCAPGDLPAAIAAAQAAAGRLVSGER